MNILCTGEIDFNNNSLKVECNQIKLALSNNHKKSYFSRAKRWPSLSHPEGLNTIVRKIQGSHQATLAVISENASAMKTYTSNLKTINAKIHRHNSRFIIKILACFNKSYKCKTLDAQIKQLEQYKAPLVSQTKNKPIQEPSKITTKKVKQKPQETKALKSPPQQTLATSVRQISQPAIETDNLDKGRGSSRSDKQDNFPSNEVMTKPLPPTPIHQDRILKALMLIANLTQKVEQHIKESPSGSPKNEEALFRVSGDAKQVETILKTFTPDATVIKKKKKKKSVFSIGKKAQQIEETSHVVNLSQYPDNTLASALKKFILNNAETWLFGDRDLSETIPLNYIQAARENKPLFPVLNDKEQEQAIKDLQDKIKKLQKTDQEYLKQLFFLAVKTYEHYWKWKRPGTIESMVLGTPFLIAVGGHETQLLIEHFAKIFDDKILTT